MLVMHPLCHPRTWFSRHLRVLKSRTLQTCLELTTGIVGWLLEKGPLRLEIGSREHAEGLPVQVRHLIRTGALLADDDDRCVLRSQFRVVLVSCRRLTKTFLIYTLTHIETCSQHSTQHTNTLTARHSCCVDLADD
uniref:(northern house mosquito) hypothetical protein n=1 Tax=Culex pipiens TaxID=7175 RepID=A0A8D8J061_CULPI